MRLGVIGASGRGNLLRHVGDIYPGAKVVACCDVEPGVYEQCKEHYGADVYFTTDYRELVKQPLDAVFVTTPDFLHEEHACACLERGLAVYLEKPMAITIAGCDRMLRLAEEHGAKIFVGHNMRYMTYCNRIKQMIAEGAIGEVKAVWTRHFVAYGGDAYFRDWHSERRYANTLLLQKGSHDIDIMHWYAGRYTRRVSAFGSLTVYDKCPRRRPDERGDRLWRPEHYPPLAQTGFSPVIDMEDQSVVIMDMGDGVTGAYLQCHFTPDACRNVTVIGTEGRIENMSDGKIHLWNRRMLEWEEHDRLMGDVTIDPDDGTTKMDAVEASELTGHGGADARIVRDFLEFVATGKRTTADPLAARMAVAVGCQAAESLRNGGMPMDIPPVEGLEGR